MGWGVLVKPMDAEKSTKWGKRVATISLHWENSTAAVTQQGVNDSPQLFSATAITAGCQGLSAASLC